MRSLVSVLLAVGVLLQPATATARPVQVGVSGDGARLLAPDGRPLFLLGVNYEGPADRAWKLWEDGAFDPGLVDADFGRAQAAGFTTLRLFVQAPLARDIAAGRWDKLDRVVALAEARRLALVVSLYDYGERDLSRVARTAGAIARRYRGRPGILAYDLKNEPRFGDLALTRYGAAVPLQQAGLIQQYGERLARADVASYRATEAGAKEVPASLSEEQAWIYVNNLRLYREMLAEAAAWVRTQRGGASTLDFLAQPAGSRWGALLDALDASLRAWIGPQLEALRSGDPTRPVTVAHVDPVLASLPANRLLDYQTLHRYPGASGSGVRGALALAAAVQRAHPTSPFVLGEFGYGTENVPQDRSAVLETATFLGLLAQGAAGGAKWMLNDLPAGYNMRERTMGAFGVDAQPKPLAAAVAALQRYLAASGAPPGTFSIEDDADAGARYIYRATDALLLGGKVASAAGGSMSAPGPAQAFVTWPERGTLRVWASGPMRLDLDPEQLQPGMAVVEPRVARPETDGSRTVPLTPGEGRQVRFEVPGAGWYTIAASPSARSEPDYAIPNGRFFTQTNGRGSAGPNAGSGFRVTNDGGLPFWDAFQALGGVEALGYPVSRRFTLDGFTVQAFQKAVLQWRPDQGNQMAFLNTFDVLHDRGKDDWLEVYRQTPRPEDTAADSGLSWEQVVARHLAFLDRPVVPAALKQRFLSNPRWLDHYGLPVSVAEYPGSVVVRAQRATFQYWKQDVPWAARGTVTVANGGDLAKEAGLWPWLASTPENP